MAERARNGHGAVNRIRPFGVAAATAGQRLGWVWSPESLWRLGLALLLAIALWLYVTGKQNPSFVDFAQPIPVSPENLGVGLTVTNTLGFVHIRYKSDTPNTYLTPQSFQASVNLITHRPGTYLRVPVNVTADPGIDVQKVSPAYVSVAIDRTLTKKVPVVASYGNTRTPPAGFNAQTARLTPNTVTVSGPESLVSQVAEAEVSLDLSGARSTILELSKPVAVNSLGALIQAGNKLLLAPAQVQVEVPIHAVASLKTLPVLVPIAGHPRTGFGVTNVSVNPAAITAKGSPSALSHISSISTSAVSVSHHGRGTFSDRVRVRFPRGVTSSVRRVQVQVRLSAVDASSSTEIGVTPQNVIPGLVAHIRPGYVLTTLVGPSSSLSAGAHGVSAVVDLTNYGIGVYQLTPHVTVPRGLIVGNVYPQTVTVTIQAASTL